MATWRAYGSARRSRGPWPRPRHHRPRRAARPAGARARSGCTSASIPRPTRCTSATSSASCSCAASSWPGHRPFPLAGGATGMIGDPGGRSEERNLLDDDTLRHNVERIKAQLSKLLDFEPGPFQATLVNNADWTASDLDARVPPRRRQALHRQPDDRQGLGAQPHRERARHLVHRVQLHAAAGQRLPAPVRGARGRAAGRRQRPVGQHRRRRRAHPPPPRQAGVRDHPPADGEERRQQVRQVGRRVRCGSTRRARRRTSSASSGCRPTTRWSAPTCKMLSLRPLDELEALLAEHDAGARAARGAARAGRRAHRDGARPAPPRPPRPRPPTVLFGGDPTTASAEALAVVAAEAPSVDAARRHRGRPRARTAHRGGRRQVEQRGQPAARSGRRSGRKSCARTPTACCAHPTCSAAVFCSSARASATSSSEKLSTRG